ncbi:MAG: hypothetical protein ACRDT6_00310 [Micromonosporaceae bacterium]
MLIDKHLIVVAEDRVVERRTVQPKIDARGTNQRTVVGESHADARRNGVVQLLFAAAQLRFRAVRIT